MELKDRLRELRGSMSQADCAAELGVPLANYNKWENGVNPSIKALCQIADYYKITLDYLVGRTDVKDIDYKNINDEVGLNETSIRSLKKIRIEAPDEFEILQFMLERDLTLSETEGQDPNTDYLIYSMAIGIPPQNPDLKYIDDFSYFRIRGLRTLLKYFTYDPESFVSYFQADQNRTLTDIESLTKSRTAEYFLTRIMNFNKYIFWTSTHRLEKKKQNKTDKTDT